ncbi:MAG: ketopantoate reductase family protein [Pseudomonadales bacterium]|nr:ketopantoate reductase family protein [Pseudomonadales bacterium]
MHFIIYGAGGIGATIGARLFQQGEQVTLIARGAHKERLQAEGLKFVSPDGQVQLSIPTVGHPEELDLNDSNAFVMLCMKSQHTEDALRAVAGRLHQQAGITCVQNGVANERMSLRYFKNTYATVVNLPAMHLEPGEVVTHATGVGGILDTGCYPGGVDARAEVVTQALTKAGFSAEPDGRVMRQKYAKLLVNLGNIVQAGFKEGEDTKRITKVMRDEALACYEAGGIDCASRDEVRDRRAAGYRLEDIPGYERTAGSSWQSLARGTGDIETEFLNGEISLLGRLHGVDTPYNDAAVEIARRSVTQSLGPRYFSQNDFMTIAHQL